MRQAGPKPGPSIRNRNHAETTMLAGTRIYMKRSGSFTVGSADEDATQCGVRGTRTIEYRVTIEGDCGKLTDEGFIIDNFAIQRYFDEKYGGHLTTLPSCETIAMQAVEDFVAMLGCDRCKSVEVTVDGTGFAGLSAAWRADGQDVPVLGEV